MFLFSRIYGIILPRWLKHVKTTNQSSILVELSHYVFGSIDGTSLALFPCFPHVKMLRQDHLRPQFLEDLPRDAWSASDLALEGFWGALTGKFGDFTRKLFWGFHQRLLKFTAVFCFFDVSENGTSTFPRCENGEMPTSGAKPPFWDGTMSGDSTRTLVMLSKITGAG